MDRKPVAPRHAQPHFQQPQSRTAQPRPAVKKRRRRRSPLLPILLCVALMAVSFGAGWFFGVRSTKAHEDVLLVNERHLLSAEYVPDDLVNLYEQRHSFRLASSDIYLTRTCYEAAQKMFAAAEAENVNGFIITSGYRDYARQAEVYAGTEAGKAQKPGASEHQTGLAFDVTAQSSGGFENTEQYAWLSLHAHEYGFIQRYPANKASETGISYEPWHYRYVGVKAATQMHDAGVTLERYLNEVK